MNSNRMSEENITVTQKILFLSYRQELYEETCISLAGQYDILYHRIRENENSTAAMDGKVVLCMIEMLRFTEKSAKLLHEIRSKLSVPILLISGARTEKTRKEEMVHAIRSGADGYLISTQSADEIAAEAIALIRLQQRIKERPEIWTYEDIQIIPDRRQVFRQGQEILLTPIEFDIVYYLAVQNGRVVTYKELYEAVWHSE